MTTIAPGCSAFQARSWSAVIESDSEQPASRSGIRTFLSGRQDRSRLGHEVDAAEDDHVGVGGGRLAREPERVADEVGDVLDLGQLVVVGEDHGVALGRERAHLVVHRAAMSSIASGRGGASLAWRTWEWLHRSSQAVRSSSRGPARAPNASGTRATRIVRQSPATSWSDSPCDPARRLELGAPADQRRRLRAAARAPCCRAAAARRPASQRLLDVRERAALHLDRQPSGRALRARAAPPRRSPPASAMWLSLTRIAS